MKSININIRLNEHNMSDPADVATALRQLAGKLDQLDNFNNYNGVVSAYDGRNVGAWCFLAANEAA
jgi:hypothetical protein